MCAIPWGLFHCGRTRTQRTAPQVLAHDALGEPGDAETGEHRGAAAR